MFFQYGHQLDVYEAEKLVWSSKYYSRLTVVNIIYKALEKREIVSICGNGATSLAKKLSIMVRREEKFLKVAMVTVSPNPNLEDIRRGIVRQIGQTQIGNCLLILDGFWWELNDEDFQTIGIPSPSRNFRIVFISRNVYMCKKIGIHQIHHIDFLEDDEAWDLFREKAGKPDEALKKTARNIVDECDGFRFAILFIASALKDKPPNVWKESLRMLQNTNRKDMDTVFSWIYSSYDSLNDIEAQIIFLICCLFPEDFNIPVEDLVLFGKGLLLFKHVDSMHQARDRVEGIVHKLKNSFFLVDGDEDDFVKVHEMYRDFGVSESSKWRYPHVVRCENNLQAWPLERMDEQKFGAISLMCKTIEQHPVDLKCPYLYLLQLSYERDSAQLPIGIFRGLGNVTVLSLSIPSLSESLTLLKNLRTLCITENISDNSYVTPRPRFGDLLGDEMKDLEILSFSTARLYNDFPRETGLLHNLRYLRFNGERLKYIPPGVLSKLEKLEELYLPPDFISWGRKEGGERTNASLSELKSLPLTSLTIGTSAGSVLAEKLVKKLRRFRVFIGSHVSVEYEFGACGNSNKLLEVFDVDVDDFTASWVSALVWKSESLRLKQVRNLKNIITWKRKLTEKRIPQWKKICISDCKELEYLVAGQIPWTSFSQLQSLKLFGLCNLKELWPGLYLQKIKGPCFGNLAEIQIMFCRKLKFVFSVSVATELRQLQRLLICFCDEMEEVFYGERMNINDGNQIAGRNASKSKLQLSDPLIEATSSVNKSIHHKLKLFSLTSNSSTRRLFARGKQQMEGNHKIMFPQLRTLELAYLDKLRIFYHGNHRAILLPSLESLIIFQCNHLEAFSYGLLETPSLQQIQVNGNQHSVSKDLNAVLKNLNRSRIHQIKPDHETQVT